MCPADEATETVETCPYFDAVLEALADSVVITLASGRIANALLDYMMDCDIDPDDYRRSGLAVWLA